MSVGIYRAIGGISLNGREWVLNDDNEIMKFNSHEDALKFLIAKTNVKNEQDMEDFGIWTDEIPEEEGAADGN
tara:strand:- start:253 stop:471 length:219 start_codon:yes stop_codon:yes gene_type:complete